MIAGCENVKGISCISGLFERKYLLFLYYDHNWYKNQKGPLRALLVKCCVTIA